MDIAKKILGKYGWKEGEGLGKYSNGISVPIKPGLKFDRAGLGVDKADEFNNHWWERIFNDAAKKVQISNEKNEDVLVRIQNPEESNSAKDSIRKLLKRKKLAQSSYAYPNFLQSATLNKAENDEVDAQAKKSVSDYIQVTNYKQQLTDEELFVACGGRTAHKGARHGLKLSGKLARIEMQEKEILSKLNLSKKNESKKNKHLQNKPKNTITEYSRIDKT